VKLICTICDRCGAPLEIEPGSKAVVCSYCNCQLRVTYSDQSAATEVSEGLEYGKRQLEAEIEELKLRRRLDRLDRGWRLYLEQFRGEHGQLHIPDRSVARGLEITGIAFLLGSGIFLLLGGLVVSAANQSGWEVTFYGLLFGTLILVVGVISKDNAARYEVRRNRHSKRRRKILKQIKNLRLDDDAQVDDAQVERPQKEHR